ncbi:hypothetical protein [Roseibium sp.]|uniref:hypothetical protein n=1 Tax=Roseibium sp. TaxID=1936156 RepID=UPI001B0DBF22|nr:hypothetical protein [Roseibium sp.]MBO6858331.1 hypothetical protein [Roseibium sp.]
MQGQIVLKDRKHLPAIIIKTETTFVYAGIKESGQGTRRVRVTLPRIDALKGSDD